MPRLKVLSSEDVIKILESFNFVIISQKAAIPNHKELDRGTLKAIFNQALKYISESELRPRFYNE